MIRLEPAAPGRVRVIGSLLESEMSLLMEALAQGAVELDLSEVDQADENAARLLAALPPERVVLCGLPHWLALWIDRLRAKAAPRN